jgi:4-hydroxy-tetrahydrodipicolinate reductase
MRLTLIGYGKMGKAIEAEAHARGHQVVVRISSSDGPLTPAHLHDAEVAIEFTRPEAAARNIETCAAAGVPVVCGTTGWLNAYAAVCENVLNAGGALLYASNFSVGVNVTMAVNRYLARLMNQFPEYECSLHEIHHVHKLDAPSGTGISLAEGIVAQVDRKTGWKLDTGGPHDVVITAERTGEVPGTHTTAWKSAIDTIELKHEAHNRKGFALGAVRAAEWVQGRSGIFSMNDVLNISE